MQRGARPFELHRRDPLRFVLLRRGFCGQVGEVERFPFRSYAPKPGGRGGPERPPLQKARKRRRDTAESNGLETRSVAQEDATGFRPAESRRAREDLLEGRLEAGGRAGSHEVACRAGPPPCQGRADVVVSGLPLLFRPSMAGAEAAVISIDRRRARVY